MRRKLVKQGPSSLTVSVPSEWIKANKLKAGDDVLMKIDQNGLLIMPEAHDESGPTISLDIRGHSDLFIGHLLSALHKKGYEEVRLTITRRQVAIIEQRVSKHLLGYEIVQQTGDVLVIRFVTRVNADELPVLIRRSFLVTLALADGVAHAGDTEQLLVLEETNNRLTNYCERVLVKNAHQQANPVFQYLFVWLLEKIADGYRDIIKQQVERNDADAETCNALLKELYEIYYKYTSERHDAFLCDLERYTRDFAARRTPFLSILQALRETTGALMAIHAA